MVKDKHNKNKNNNNNNSINSLVFGRWLQTKMSEGGKDSALEVKGSASDVSA